jgi:hypothetical protein
MSTLDPGVTGRGRPASKKRPKKAEQKAKPAKATKTTKAASEKKEPKKVLDTPPGSPFKTIPQAGRDYFGMSKNGSYDAAERGDFGKLVTIGRRKFVVVPVIEAMIKAAAEAAE